MPDHAGLMRIDRNAIPDRIRLYLPPEHRVTATREVPDMPWMIDVIVEGASLPAWPDRRTDPLRLELEVRAEHNEHAAACYEMWGRWRRDDDRAALGEPWRIGAWPTWGELEQAIWQQ